MRRFLGFCLVVALAIVVAGLAAGHVVRSSSAPFLSNDAAALPACRAGLVLGTSPRLGDGSANPFFTHRMEAAARLLKSGRVRCLILSGDNRRQDYNEPDEMRKALIGLGLPDSCLFADYAGLRTFDSMLRCRDIFGQDTVIVVSQQFHNERAVYIGRHFAMQAFGYNAKAVTAQHAVKIGIREFFSRIKCVLDLYILNTRPRHMGEKISIP